MVEVVIKFEFPGSNKQLEYTACLVGLRKKFKIGAEEVIIKSN